jgi:tetratricopeptide (TPR) repeat protein
MARHELLDVRPAWGGGKLNATALLLEPLAEAEAHDLLHHLIGPARLDDRAVARILTMADGNPLFVEEVVAGLIDDDVVSYRDDDASRVAGLFALAVPPTIQALIAARIDRLGPNERAVIEAASIEGKEFARDRLEALVPDGVRDSVSVHLRTLVRKDLIRPTEPTENTFRFRHQLIRDGAYDGMPKELRADLHERFADILDDAAPFTLGAADELLGYHLERAVLLRRELGAAEAVTANLAARAATCLRAAGQRASQRDDPASIRLLERAVALTPPAEHAPILVELAGALARIGDLERSAATARTAVETASAAGDRQAAVRARLIACRVMFEVAAGETDLDALDAAARPLLEELEDLGDDEGTTDALLLLGHINMNDFGRSSRYLERALAIAERTGNRRDAAYAVRMLGLITVFGPIAAAEGIERCRDLRRRVADHQLAVARLLGDEALLNAMRGRIDEARVLYDDCRHRIEDIGNPVEMASIEIQESIMEMLPGHPTAQNELRGAAWGSSRTWAARPAAQQPPPSSRSRSFGRAALSKPCGMPTLLPLGRRPMTSCPRPSSSAPARTSSWRAVNSRRRRLRRARPCCSPSAPTTSLNAATP